MEKVYLASPFFNEEQCRRERKVCSILRSNGYDVYAPFEHGIVGTDIAPCDKEKIFKDNVTNINTSDLVVAITDGKDMGTIWEAGYAYGVHKPVVYYAETLGDNPFNIMLGFSGCGVFTKELSFAIAALRHNLVNNDGKVCKAE